MPRTFDEPSPWFIELALPSSEGGGGLFFLEFEDKWTKKVE